MSRPRLIRSHISAGAAKSVTLPIANEGVSPSGDNGPLGTTGDRSSGNAANAGAAASAVVVSVTATGSEAAGLALSGVAAAAGAGC